MRFYNQCMKIEEVIELAKIGYHFDLKNILMKIGQEKKLDLL